MKMLLRNWTWTLGVVCILLANINQGTAQKVAGSTNTASNDTKIWAELLFQKAVLFNRTGHYTDAIETLYFLKKSGYSTPESRFQLFMAQVGRRDFEQALETIRELYEEQPNSYPTFVAYLSLLLRTGQKASILSTLQEYIRNNPDDNEAKLDLITFLMENGQPEEAQEQLKKLSEETLSEKNKRSYYTQMLELSFRERNIDEALRCSKILMTLDPGDASLLMRHIVLLTMAGQYDEADKHLDQLALILPRNSFDFIHFCSAVFQEQSNVTKLSELLLDYFADKTEISPIEKENLLNPTINFLSDQNESSVDTHLLWKRFIGLSPDNDELMHQYYLYIKEREGYDRAIETITKYLQETQTARSAFQVVATEIKDKGKLHTLLALANKALSNDPLFVVHYSSSLLTLREYNQAIELLLNFCNNETIEKKDKGTPALQLADIYYYTLKDKDKADRWYRFAHQCDPQNPIILNNFSFFLAKEKVQEIDWAVRLAAQAADALPQEANVQDTYGYTLFIKGNYLLAEIYFRRAVELAQEAGKEKPLYIENLGDALFMNQKEDEAIQTWQKAFKQAPSERLKWKIENRSLQRASSMEGK